MYLGDQLADVINQLERGEAKSSKHTSSMRIGVDALPPLPRDATDRNRTSPFAFTGNKFEFRAPGSSQSCSGANLTLNVIVAEAFDRMADALAKFGKKDFHAKLQKHLQGIVKAQKRILFNGDGYTEEWLKEAAKRGLPNAPATMDALRSLNDKANRALFQKYGVFTERELGSRFEVFLEDYHRKVRIEGGVALEIARTMIAPAVEKAFASLCRAAVDAKAKLAKAAAKARKAADAKPGDEKAEAAAVKAEQAAKDAAEGTKIPETFKDYLDKYVYGCKTHEDLLNVIGGKRLTDLRVEPHLGYSTRH